MERARSGQRRNYLKMATFNVNDSQCSPTGASCARYRGVQSSVL
jgi:hypothetical protein